MPMFYLFRVFVQDQSDYDNDQDEWVSFDSVYVTADFGPRDIFQDKDQEMVARNELQKIATRKIFRAVIHRDIDIHTLHTLFLLQQQELLVDTEIELYKYDNIQGKDAAILLASMAFNSRIARHSVDTSDNYDFRFQIVGSVDLRNAPDLSGAPGIIDKYSESLSSYSTRSWRKVSSIRTRFWIEAGLATLCGSLGVLTLFTRDWIEALTGFNPDNHTGSSEWTIVAALFLVCILLSIAARADWRRLSLSARAGI